MKSAVLITTLECFFLFTGCNDSPVVDPVGAPQPGSVQNLAEPTVQGRAVISIDAVVPMNRVSGLSWLVQVSGSAKYDVTLEPILAQDIYRVKLALQASLSPLNGIEPIWFFSGESEDQVTLNNVESTPTVTTSVKLTKQYRTGDESSAIVLTVVYRVTRSSVSIDDMWCTEYFQ